MTVSRNKKRVNLTFSQDTIDILDDLSARWAFPSKSAMITWFFHMLSNSTCSEEILADMVRMKEFLEKNK